MKHDACACCGSANISQLEKLLWNRILFKNCVMQNYIFKLDLKSKKLHNFQYLELNRWERKRKRNFFKTIPKIEKWTISLNKLIILLFYIITIYYLT